MPEKPLAVIVKLPIIADSFVSKQNPDTNYGKAETIHLNSFVGTDEAEGYIKVDLSAIPLNVTVVSAKLCIYGAGGVTGALAYFHHCYNDDWSEDIITWNNWNPPFESEYDSVLMFRDFGWYETDLTKTIASDYKAGKKVSSFRMIPNGMGLSAWNSKDSGRVPYVEVTLQLAPPTHTLSISSSPVSGVTFTIDGLTRTTPFSATIDEGTYTLTMPSTVTIGGVEYQFVNWADGVTTPSRTINLTADMSLTANYKAVVPMHTVTMRASPEVGVPATVDGRAIGNTPVSVEVVEGDHVFSVPSEVEV